MDKLSGVLIGAICLVLSICGAVVYGAWFSEQEDTVAVSSWKQIQEEVDLASIAMNDEAQVINGGSQDMWMRVKIQDAGYHLVSDTIAESATEAQLRMGVWTLEDDGYYYYSLPVRPGEQSKSLFQMITGTDGAKDSNVRVQAEAIQINWISEMAENGKEAFQSFQLEQPLQSCKGKFV